MLQNLKKYTVEFIGTFFLVFTVCSVVFAGGNAVSNPIAIGVILAVMVYAGGNISGGHYNPAVSLGAAVRGALPWKAVFPYWISQCLAAAAAAGVFKAVHQDLSVLPVADMCLCGVTVAELLFTFALVYVVLLTATNPHTSGNSYFGFAIGSTVTAGAYTVGGISLAAFNPAVALGLLVLGAADCTLFSVTVAANLAGAVLAALTYKFVTDEK